LANLLEPQEPAFLPGLVYKLQSLCTFESKSCRLVVIIIFFCGHDSTVSAGGWGDNKGDGCGRVAPTRLRLEPSSLRASRGLTKVIVAIFTDGAKLARVGAMVPSGAGELVRTVRKPWHAPALSVVLAFRNTAFTAGPNADFQGGNQSQPPPQPPQPPSNQCTPSTTSTSSTVGATCNMPGITTVTTTTKTGPGGDASFCTSTTDQHQFPTSPAIGSPFKSFQFADHTLLCSSIFGS
jgi:hypothetical protein